MQIQRLGVQVLGRGVCALPTEQQPLRVAEFEALLACTVGAAERPEPTLLRLHLDAGAQVEAQARDLTARESSCCSFFTFTFSRPSDDRLQLDIAVPAEHAGVLDCLAARAQAGMR
jgi:hypothetical protein